MEYIHMDNNKNLLLNLILKNDLILIIIIIFLLITLIQRERKSFLELKKLNYIVNHDCLTGLKNRNCLEEEIEKFCKKSKTNNSSLYFIDLNKFKMINDTYGHEIGDMVLKYISNQFQIQGDETILPIRLSGDEFLIIKNNIENLDHSNLFINEYIQKISLNSFKVNDNIIIPLSFSYGGVLFNKNDFKNNNKISSIIKIADEKMYKMKKRSVNKN